MRLREIFEQTVSPVPPGQGGILPTTTPTRSSSTQDQPDKSIDDLNKEKIRTNLNRVNGSLSAAGVGNIDVNKLTDIFSMSKNTDPNKPLDPELANSLKYILPGIGVALQDPQSAGELTQAVKSGVIAHNTQQQKDQEQKQPVVKSQQMGVAPPTL